MRYIYMKGTHGQFTKEREPMRRLDIYDPSHYKGQLGINNSTHQVNTEKVFVVNANVDKCDANFLEGFWVEKVDGK